MNTRILYVEDEEFLGKIVKETLEGRGFEVHMAADGNEVMPLFRESVPDVCVLDVMLPNRSGFELARDIRNTHREVPIIFLTAKTQTEDVVRGFSLGGNDYLRKPFSMEELIVRIENLVSRKKAATYDNEVLLMGRYSFDPRRQSLTLEGTERKLSYREAELLKFLWLKRFDIIERKDVLNYIWGNDSFFNSRNLDVYITKLRGYLRKDPSIEILTIKGVGYRFVFGRD